MARKITTDFLKTEAGSALVLGAAALAALIIANSPLAATYFGVLKSVQPLQVGPLALELTVSEWIKEGLMALFFLVVGLEVKHEVLHGELSQPKSVVTPVVAALGGMLGPVLVYLACVPLLGAPSGGWPIPVATDIAFALGVLALVGKGLPPSLRTFLLTLAIVDDIGAILLIGALYSSGVEAGFAFAAAAVLAGLGLAARRGRLPDPVWIIGFGAAWWLTVLSGLSTSLTAVAFALIVPSNSRTGRGRSPLDQTMHDLHPYNAYFVLPLFAFAKAGVALTSLTVEQAAAPLVIAVALGLFVGKQAGVLGAVWLVTKTGVGDRPSRATWLQIYGVSLLCGVGFTMSLFLGALAFPGATDAPVQSEVKLGVLAGSLLSAIVGALVLSQARRRQNAAGERPAEP